MSDDARAAERCHRRAAALLAEGDVVLSDAPPPAALLAALDDATRAGVRWPPGPLDAPTLCIIAARDAAQDGSLLCGPAAARCAGAAVAAGIPVYALLPNGPSPAIRAGSGLPRAPGAEPLTPGQISAVITSRGIYRPAMLARHLSDGDAPLDVIPLTPSGG